MERKKKTKREKGKGKSHCQKRKKIAFNFIIRCSRLLENEKIGYDEKSNDGNEISLTGWFKWSHCTRNSLGIVSLESSGAYS